MDLFPFEQVREGQREFLEDARNAIRERSHLVAHAPTGIGKTAAALSAALEYAIENNKTVFFLTPKHTQHTIVVDTLKMIKRRYGIEFVMVDIIGKQWTCPHNVRDLDSREFNEFCRTMKKDERCKYYNNVRKRKLSKNAKSIIERIKKDTMHNEEISRLCSDNMLCPYEICVEVGKDSTVVVCDYFHMFSPPVRKAFMSKLNKTLNNAVLIIDEAHNLPDRIRKLLSHKLTEYSLKKATKEANFFGYEHLSDAFREMVKVFKNLGKGMQEEERLVKREEFMDSLRDNIDLDYGDLVETSRELGEEVLKIPNRHRSYSKTISRFLEKWRGEDMGYARILKREEITSLTYTCLDPSLSSTEIFKEVHSSIFMSGTLVPLSMYADVLDLQHGRTIMREYSSPFPKENRLTLLVPGVTTKYSKRSEFMYRKYANLIASIIRFIPGNAAVFFPSYRILETIRSGLSTLGHGKKILAERQDMKKEDRTQLYNQLVSSRKPGVLLLGVQAGSMSEGVDYANNILDGVIVVGLPLEIPNLEVKSLIEYYDFKFERGWDYGYIYPAMNRALQAAGRCIRSETDKGVIVLMDERFNWKNYSKCLPHDFEPTITEMPEKYIKRFFG
ncbi:MAG: ATP-dependent DNA helicase [Candidatus Altiarchaeota archaeon]|nr:ATP-dependent DNA helicase [Candidatus Altiarchaeota archaeon]